jgi:hypothetical protein
VTVFDGHPFRELDAGQPGGLLDRQTGLGAGGPDAKPNSLSQTCRRNSGR